MIAGLLVVATLLDRSPWLFLSGLGALAAFRGGAFDTLLLLDTDFTWREVELLLVEKLGPRVWEALAKPARRLRPGTVLELEGGLGIEVLAQPLDGLCGRRRTGIGRGIGHPRSLGAG